MLVYLDSVICIYAVEGAASFKSRARAKLATMAADGDQPVISDLTWLECRVRPIRVGDVAALADIEAFLSGSDVIRLTHSTSAFVRACHIRAKFNYKLGDSLHLATAIEGGCQRFFTNDVRPSGFPDLVVEVLP